MNEVNMLNIGGVDYNIDDQCARDLIAHSENGLDSQSNLPISSRHYDEGEYLIGQDRYYYEATMDIDPGDVLAEGTNLRKTLLSDEIVSLKNQSSIAVIQCIAKRETGALATSSYPIIGSYLYWDYGLTAGLYETIAAITAGDALTIGVNLKSANKIADTMDGLQDAYNITGAKNLCPNNMQDTVQQNTTYTKNSDGSINVVSPNNGPTVSNSITIGSNTLPAGVYKLTCLAGSDFPEDQNLAPIAVTRKSDGTVIGRSSQNGGIFTLATPTEVYFWAEAVAGYGAINVRIFPMCRVASVTDDTYVPFAMTNKQLTERFSGIVRKLLWTGDVYSSTNQVYVYTPTISDMMDYDLVYIQGTSGDGAFSILHDNKLGSLGYLHTAYEGAQYNTTGQIYIDTNNKRVGIRTYVVSGWGVTVNHLKNIIGYKLF